MPKWHFRFGDYELLMAKYFQWRQRHTSSRQWRRSWFAGYGSGGNRRRCRRWNHQCAIGYWSNSGRPEADLWFQRQTGHATAWFEADDDANTGKPSETGEGASENGEGLLSTSDTDRTDADYVWSGTSDQYTALVDSANLWHELSTVSDHRCMRWHQWKRNVICGEIFINSCSLLQLVTKHVFLTKFSQLTAPEVVKTCSEANDDIFVKNIPISVWTESTWVLSIQMHWISFWWYRNYNCCFNGFGSKVW